MDNSQLFNELTFYSQFKDDLNHAKSEVVIESPFISTERMKILHPIFEKLVKRNIKVYILTRDPKEQTYSLEQQSESEIQWFEKVGIKVYLIAGNHHRKLAIIDRHILWEGSLNILSQTKSREVMRRIEGKIYAKQMLRFTKLDTVI